MYIAFNKAELLKHSLRYNDTYLVCVCRGLLTRMEVHVGWRCMLDGVSCVRGSRGARSRRSCMACPGACMF